MARTRFVGDSGLTARMTLVMFLLGGLFVVLVVGLALAVRSPALGLVIGVVGIGIAIYQWARSDVVAMRAMRAREVTPAEAPELHGMVERLCALADMPKPRVGVADTPVPNAFATGRSPDRAVVCVTTGILQLLTAEELEGVLAHELSHVAHRDVLVMTVASSAGIAAGTLSQGARFGGLGMMGGGRRDNRNGLPVWVLVLFLSLLVYAVSFLLLRLLSRYRELSADRAGAYLTLQPGHLASALQKIAGGVERSPQQDLREVAAGSALCITPMSLGGLTSTHPPLQRRLEQLARIERDLAAPGA
ncbi:zinc metalloprotease HtpX [Nocardioides litoris]|uniref:zinc metalloprotease HtpX n=1 Tax=Nocardioides litoris TaxID=1926648 RepID=UPI001120D98C|nr:zinc metalloprotease HtpX [Nocardioides litoris]